jgi:hypothetical protein
VLTIPVEDWAKPRGLGQQVGLVVPQFLIGLQAGTGSDLTVTLGTANGGQQNLCNATTQTTTNESQQPNVISVSEFPMVVVSNNTDAGAPITVHSTVHDLKLTDVLPRDTAASSGIFEATIDFGELYPLFPKVNPPTAEGACGLLSQVSAACGTCAYSSEDKYCLTIRAEELGAVASSTQIKQISVADLASSCP